MRALRWLGRSYRERTESAAYLCAAIAFETLLKEPGRQGTVALMLRLRAAHLIGPSRRVRETIMDRVRDLYENRSAIVHSGEEDIDLDELNGMRWLVDRAIGAFIARRFHRLSNDQIARWFKNRLL